MVQDAGMRLDGLQRPRHRRHPHPRGRHLPVHGLGVQRRNRGARGNGQEQPCAMPRDAGAQDAR